MSRLTSLPLTIEYALLGFLQAQPMHGYQLYQELSAPNGLWLVWRIKQGQLYALLTKLEESGYLTSTVEPQETRPPRKIFQLTECGRTTFQGWLTTPVARPRQMRQEFLAKLFFAQRAGQAITTTLLEAQRAMCRSWQGSEPVVSTPAFVQVVTSFRLSQVEALLLWLDRCEENLAVLSAEQTTLKNRPIEKTEE